MTYRVDPKAKAAKPWHELLNNGFHFALCHPQTGAVIEKARYANELSYAHRLRPFLKMISIDEQI